MPLVVMLQTVAGLAQAPLGAIHVLCRIHCLKFGLAVGITFQDELDVTNPIIKVELVLIQSFGFQSIGDSFQSTGNAIQGFPFLWAQVWVSSSCGASVLYSMTSAKRALKALRASVPLTPMAVPNAAWSLVTDRLAHPRNASRLTESHKAW